MVNGPIICNLNSTDNNPLYKELEWNKMKTKVLGLLITKRKYNPVGIKHSLQKRKFVRRKIRAVVEVIQINILFLSK